MDTLQLSQPSLDDDLRLLADNYRRQILRYLIAESSETVSFDELIQYLRGHVAGESNRETIQTCLYHRHLPTMAEHGVIEYDTRSGSVRYRPHDRIETILECLPDE